jgi:LysM repeat protein
MAAKKAKSTKQYRQAKKAAKPAAKAAFPGKVQASRRDPMAKISAEDRLALQEMRDTAKQELGKNQYLSKEAYQSEQRAAREKFRESMRQEFGEYGGKKATPEVETEKAKVGVKKSAPTKKKSAKKAAVKKVAPSKPSVPATTNPVNAPTVTDKRTPAEKKLSKKAAKKEVTKNTKKFGTKKPLSVVDTPVGTNRPTDASLRANEDAYLKKTKERLDKKAATKKPTAPKTTSAAKPEVKGAPKPAAKAAVAKKGSRTFRVAKFAAKKFPLAMLAGEVVSAGKGSTFKDLREINRLKAKLGNKPMSAKEGAATQASNLANLATMGLVGKTRRQRMDELNAKIKKKAATQAKANKGLRYGKGGESLVPGTAAYKAGSKTRPTTAAASTPTTGAGGATTRYVVKKGDTLSGIAKNAGLTLSEVRAINPELMKNPKYKKGSVIWSGTKVNVKKK